jgi:hypothetical protein
MKPTVYWYKMYLRRLHRYIIAYEAMSLCYHFAKAAAHVLIKALHFTL